MPNLKRKQIYFDEESDRALKMLAIETKISESEHIRRAVAKYIVKEAFGFDDHFKTMGLILKPAKTKF